MMKSYNKYDVFIFLLIASLIGGNLFGALQVPRVLTILFAIPCANCKNNIRFVSSSLKKWLVAFVLFSFISSIWSPAGFTLSIESSLYNAVHALLFYEILVFSGSAKKPLDSIAFGFFVAFTISALVALWELTTDNHLQTSKMKEALTSNTGYGIYVRYFAAATFFNFNMYVTFLCFIFPFLTYGFANSNNNTKYRTASLSACVIAIILVLYNGSRGGLLAMLIMVAVLVVKMRMGKGVFFYLTAGIGGVIYLLYKYGGSILLTLTMRASTQGAMEDESRFVIWNNVFGVISDYPIIGCGAGGINFAMQKFTNEITVAHNLFLEILSQYGILFFIAFVAFIWGLYKSAKLSESPSRKLCVFMSVFSIPVVSIINSTYLAAPSLWAVMASLYIFANYEQIKYNN